MEFLNPPEEFDFPFVPYEIQKSFMKNLYIALEDKKIGIFESPTGTGKSMSIICGALTWLRDNDRRVRLELEKVLSLGKMEMKDKENNASSDDVGDPDWIVEFTNKKERSDEQESARAFSEKIAKRDLKMKRIFQGLECDSADEPKQKRMKFARHGNHRKEDETAKLLQQAKLELDNHDKYLSGNISDIIDSEFILEEYDSDEGCEDGHHLEQDDDENDAVQKIYYCSRTHSQLSQFIKEVQKSPFANVEVQGMPQDSTPPLLLSVVPLASRNSMCVNESVRKLPLQQLNDRCLDMQKNVKKEMNEDDEGSPKKRKKKSGCTCPFYKNRSIINDVKNRILGKIQDIEDIVKMGKEKGGCPYYAARYAVPVAQLIVLPYQTLLHGGTRKASGINLKGAIIIVDEAHNLVDTISNIHSFEVTFKQTSRALNQLTQYAQKFSKRLKAKNLMYVKQILFILKNLLNVMGVLVTDREQCGHDKAAQRGTNTVLMTIHEFLFQAKIDNINLFKVLRYCQRSMISRKLNGFVEKYDDSSISTTVNSSTVSKFILKAKKSQSDESSEQGSTRSAEQIMQSPLMHIESFLSSLTSANEDGRIALTMAQAHKGSEVTTPMNSSEQPSIKFLLLNPAAHFTEILNECRSLIVAGGTMQPSSSFVNELLLPAGVPQSRVFEFSCGHVIDKDQLLPMVLSNGPSGAEFEFTFDKRKNPKLIDELGRMLCNLCNIIPGGIICFFPSYEYERFVHTRWQQADILSRIGARKKIFREPKKTSQVESVLSEYTACIQRSKSGRSAITGALLLSVVGGKMSEGINFSDDLGRCVVMVGLPYPNMYSPELKEKMAYLDKNMPRVGTKSAGQSYYENLCMKAVNQSIGRAIRHRDDHACILLADKRYARSNITSQLPGWIADKLQTVNRFGTAFSAVRKFFLTKKTTV